jgi:hypothetical protein
MLVRYSDIFFFQYYQTVKHRNFYRKWPLLIHSNILYAFTLGCHPLLYIQYRPTALPPACICLQPLPTASKASMPVQACLLACCTFYIHFPIPLYFPVCIPSAGICRGTNVSAFPGLWAGSSAGLHRLQSWTIILYISTQTIGLYEIIFCLYGDLTALSINSTVYTEDDNRYWQNTYVLLSQPIGSRLSTKELSSRI